MNARKKLNTSYAFGSLLFAALVGWLTGSLLIFAFTAIALFAGSYYAGDIRLSNHSQPRGTGRIRR